MADGKNPILMLDYPDMDIIRVNDTYYGISTTMHYMPGGVILRSYDLIHWEHAAYIYDILEDDGIHNMDGDGNFYGKGMWAATLRQHRGKFYAVFVANETHKTYLFVSDTIEGHWERKEIKGFYHDCSLLFDDDGRVYIAYGNSQIYLTELNEDLSAPKPNGLHRLVLKDDDNIPLGHEGCHIYKLFGKYYIFTIHAADKNRFMRTQTCYMAESLTDEFIGHDILNDDMNYFGNGVAQGGVVATPEGDWYLFVFQDRGAVGRIPVIVPMHWENDYPVINGNKIPENLSIKSTRPLYTYSPLVESDNFINSEIKKCWQWNHNPHKNLWRIKDGILYITTDKICINVTKARNILTQRAMFPQSGAEVTVDASALNDGDFAGLAVMQSNYAMVGIEKCGGKYYIVMLAKKPITNAAMYCRGITNDTEPPVIYERVPISSPAVTVGVSCDFTDMKDTARFYYKSGNVCRKIGVTHKLWFWLDHFTGARFALAVYSTKAPSGTAGFSEFVYNRH